MKQTHLVILLAFLLFFYSGSFKNEYNFQTRKTVNDTDYNKTNQKNVSVYSFTYQGKKYLYKNSENNCGITDEKGYTIIPFEFDYIVYPGETYNGIVEVCKNNKVGLYSFPGGKQITPLEFDEFYPVYDHRILAYYKKGNSYDYIKKNKSNPDADFEKYLVSPFENGTVEKWNFHFPKQAYINQEEAIGLFLLPSFMKHFNYDIKQYGSEIDQTIEFDEIELSITNKIKDNNKSFYFVKTTSGDYGIRYTICSKNLSQPFYRGSVNSYLEYSYNNGQKTIKNGFEFKMLENNIYRIKNMDGQFVGKQYKNYPKTTIYSYYYYQLVNGRIKQIETKRFFAFTKYEKITSEFFKGFFIGEPFFSEEDGPSAIFHKHLSISDLDIMRNEIFADYGYKFNSQKWQSFFGQLNWYKPQFNDVNDKLNEIEKYNVKMILQEKGKMKNKEQYYLKTDTASINSAG